MPQTSRRDPAPRRDHPTPAALCRGAPLPPHRAIPDALNAAQPKDAERTLLTCCGSRHWARRVAAHRPYPDLDALLAAADEAAYDLAPDDLAEALAAEPLEPSLPPGHGYEAAATALRAATAAYESRFGHAFVVCLDAVAPSEALDHLLASIRDRLGNDPEEERAVAAEELRRLARGRLTRLVHAQAAPTAANSPAAPPAQRGEPHRDSPYVPV
ncbi:2-oxo-4-hydroxy-4-carboxy-5-ureidoimidazoline decarboxylase [Streptomyces alboflavus]|uniref:2-oxo-4-hydroxy-4-carboxy-5-ureidoimidazoline decarboxylase n=1 Tax=Streptomyces alboflavus TaxID=67267 RepID=UPI00068C4CE6